MAQDGWTPAQMAAQESQIVAPESSVGMREDYVFYGSDLYKVLPIFEGSSLLSQYENV